MPYCPLCDKQSPCKHWPSSDTAVERRMIQRGKEAAMRDIGRGMTPLARFAYLATPRNGLARWSVL